ncbi:NAD(+) salvage pathway protein [Friedmanniomyces endolithicus]|nr:NAD(+) salvage pathway protein [Friedmanniomyces endolithicus]
MTNQGKAALVIVDLQNDFCPPDGALAVPGGRDIAPAINKLLDLPFALKIATRDFHPRDHVSFASQHTEKQPFTSSHTITNPENPQETQETILWPDHCVQDTSGCELISELDTSELGLVVDKGQDKRVESYSAFGPPFRSPRVSMSQLADTLRHAGITHVFVCGLAWDFCVKATAIDAAKEGFTTFAIHDASRGIDRSAKGPAATREEMEKHGVRVIGLESKEFDMVRGP